MDNASRGPEGAASPIRVLQYPHYSTNPYQEQLAQALAAFGVETIFCRALKDVLGTLRTTSLSALHIHWVDAEIGRNPMKNSARLFLFARTVLSARLRGIRVVWTLHNAQSNWPKSPLFDWLFSFAIGLLADRVIVHGPHSATVARRRFRVSHRKIVVIPHWNYATEVERCPAVTNKQKRPRFLGFGQIRQTKGFGDIAALFAKESPAAELRIVGQPRDEREALRIEQTAASTALVSAKLQYLTTEELRHELCASTFVVLPYRRILTSGSLLMSLTAGRPVIAPRLGDIASVVNDKAAILYDPSDPQGLSNAIQEALALSPASVEKMQKAAWKLAQQYPLARSAQMTFDAYGLPPILTHDTRQEALKPASFTPE